jgi:formylglycine-generating enzyme
MRRTRFGRSLLWLASAVVSLQGCRQVLGIEGPELVAPEEPTEGEGGSGQGGVSGEGGVSGKGGAGGKGGSGGSAGTGGQGGNAGSGGITTCPGSGGPAMVLLPQGYCIDSTEVTRDQYAAWLATSPSTAGQPSSCQWNNSFTPPTNNPADGCDGSNWPPGAKGNLPVVCVDWCDALAYCKGVGKRLCGRIGGGANGYSDNTSASKSQWYNACTSGGNRAYPYGNTYQKNLCNGRDNDATGCPNMSTCSGTCLCTVVDVGTLNECVSNASGYAGVYDLSGNVWEWEDCCNGNTGANDICRLRGGSIACANHLDESCAGAGYTPPKRSGAGWDTGFRCCS